MLTRCLISTAVLLLPIHLPHPHTPGVLKQLSQVTVADIAGPIEHMAADVKGHRIFVAATGNNSVEIFDSQTLHHLGAITELAQPQDLVFMPDRGQLLISNAADGSLRTYDATTLKLIDTKKMGGDADCVRVFPGGKSAVVGWGVGAMTFVDLQSGQRTNIHLDSHPESFELDSIGNHIFVNLPGIGQISVVDRRSQTVIESWQIHARENMSMALDEANRRVFVVCHKPARLLVMNMDDGSQLASLSTVADADNVFYDKLRKRIYVVGGEGLLAAYKQKGPDEYVSLGRTDSLEEGRTGLFVPEWNRLYVVARDRPPFPAELASFAVLEDGAETAGK